LLRTVLLSKTVLEIFKGSIMGLKMVTNVSIDCGLARWRLIEYT